MLENIHIQNFRCFEDFKAEGFERINLIGGKNNSGKTCLLEGILSLRYGFHEISSLRLEGWTDCFNVNNKNDSIEIQTIINNHNYTININRSGAGSSTSGIEEIIQYVKIQKKYPDYDVAQKFDLIDKNKLANELLNAINYVDTNIDGLRTFGETGLKLFISTKGEIWKSITSYGDAVAHLVNYFSFLLSKKANKDKNPSILLIDEIENGIHYSAHYDFWKAIFTLSKELNVQVFATTHSKEMIEQFNIVSKEFELINNKKTGAYFEMMRNVRTNKIVAHKYEAQELEYSLDNEKTFRGE